MDDSKTLDLFTPDNGDEGNGTELYSFGAGVPTGR